MTYHGRVKNGVVVLDDDAKMPEGTVVRVEPIGERPLMDLVGAADGLPGVPEWPPDGAAEPDPDVSGPPHRNR